MNLLPEAEKDKRIEELQRLLEVEQHARFGAEQDIQHWQERCEDALAKLERLRLESLRCPQCGSENVRPPTDEGCECRDCGYVFDADEALS
jgi:predicted Zn-ribbon and HTH transcriptional regulator